jgi:photosystem II stability/assembly factor-like uncharacterized protein
MKTFLVFIIILYQITSAQWIQQESNSDVKLTDVIMLDSSTAVVVGEWNTILKTTNAGKTWLNLAAILSSIIKANSISFFDENFGTIACDRGVVTTTNQLKNWQWKLYLPGQRCLSALQLNYNNIYVGTDSGWIYHSLDTGKTWTSEKISDQPVRALFAWQGPFTEFLPIYALTPNSLFTKSEYPSGKWKESADFFQGLGSEAFDGEFCKGGGPGYIVGVQGDLRAAPTVLRKSISDTVWKSVSSGIIGDGVFHGVSAPSENVAYVCGTNGMIFKSTNGGETWKKEKIPTTKNINAIYFFDESHGFAVGDSGLILYTSTGGLTNIENKKIIQPDEFNLYQNYPNPFNPRTVISYQLSVNSNVTLKVFNTLGQEVETLVDVFQNAGFHSSLFTPSSSLSSGIYFYVLKAEEFLETKKMCLIK